MDISNELLEKIRESFNKRIEDSFVIRTFSKKLEKGTATQEEVVVYTKYLATFMKNAIAEVFTQENLPNGQFYFNILEKVIPKAYEDVHGIVMRVAVEVQKSIDIRKGIRLNPITPDANIPRAKALVHNVMNGVGASEEIKEAIRLIDEGVEVAEEIKDKVYKKRKELLLDDMENLCQSSYDDFIKSNVEFRYQAGFEEHIVRIYTHKGKHDCEFCKRLQGTFTYPNTPKDIFKRHKGCGCRVYHISDYGVQNVHRQDLQLSWEEIEALNKRKRLFK